MAPDQSRSTRNETRGDRAATSTKVKRLAEFGVATLYEASGRQGLVDVPLISLAPEICIAGPALTVRCGQGDNLMVHAAIEHIRPGDVVVLSMPEPEPVALIGDLLVEQMARQGAAGVLVDAAVRDVTRVIELGLPVWTRYVRVRGPDKVVPGELNGRVTVGGCAIDAGDFVVLDADGAVVVDADLVDLVLEAAAAREEQEASLREAFQLGKLSVDMMDLRRLLSESED